MTRTSNKPVNEANKTEKVKSTNKTNKPCVGICSTTLGDDVCRGCGLTSEDVVGWNGYEEDRKREIVGRLAREREVVAISRWELNRLRNAEAAFKRYRASIRRIYCESK